MYSFPDLLPTLVAAILLTPILLIMSIYLLYNIRIGRKIELKHKRNGIIGLIASLILGIISLRYLPTIRNDFDFYAILFGPAWVLSIITIILALQLFFPPLTRRRVRLVRFSALGIFLSPLLIWLLVTFIVPPLNRALNERHVIRKIAGHAPCTTHLAFSPDGQLLATSGNDYTPTLWSVSTGASVDHCQAQPRLAGPMCFIPNTHLIAAGGADGFIYFFDYLNPGQNNNLWPASLYAHSQAIYALACSDDGRLIVSFSRDGSAKMWKSGSIKAQWSSQLWVNNAVLAGTAPVLAIVSGDDQVNTLSLANGTIAKTFKLDCCTTSRIIALDNDGQRLLEANGELVHLIELATGNIVTAHLDEHASAMAFASSTPLVADRQGKVWQIASNGQATVIAKVNKLDSNYYPMLLTATGLLMVAEEQAIIQLEVKTGKLTQKALIPKPRSLRDSNTSLAASRDGKLIAATYSQRSRVHSEALTWRVWPLHESMPLPPPVGHIDLISQTAFAPDGMSFATASDDATIRLWSVPNCQAIAVLSGHQAAVRAIAFSPHDQMLLSGDNDGKVILWSLTTKQQTRAFAYNQAIEAIAYDSTKPVAAIALSDNSVIFQSLADTSWAPSALTKISDNNRPIFFSKDGGTLITTTPDCNVRLTAIATGKQSAVLPGIIRTSTQVGGGISRDCEWVWAYAAANHNIAMSVGERLFVADPADERKLAALLTIDTGINAVAFSPQKPELLAVATCNPEASVLLIEKPK